MNGMKMGKWERLTNKKVFDSILEWSPTLRIVLGPPGVPISLKSVFFRDTLYVNFICGTYEGFIYLNFYTPKSSEHEKVNLGKG